MPKYKVGDIVKTSDGMTTMLIDSIDSKHYHYTFLENDGVKLKSYKFFIEAFEEAVYQMHNYNIIWSKIVNE